jgi:hypothetical protein
VPDNALPTAQDDAASKKMLDETIQNLGVEVLILPTVNFVDPVRGTSPLRDGPRILRKIAKWDTAINAKADALTALFVGARAGLLLNFFLFPLARWLQFSPLPPCVRTLHIAPQFCLAGLPLSQLGSLDEVIHKAFIEVMRRVFAASAPCHGISARPDAAGVGTVDPPLAPIIELPDELAPADGKAQALAAPVEHARAPWHPGTLAPWHPGTLAPWHPGPGTLAEAVFEDSGEGWGARCAVFRGESEHATRNSTCTCTCTCLHIGIGQAPLLLCYFLVQKDARRLERLIAKEGLPNVEVHCFTYIGLQPGHIGLQPRRACRRVYCGAARSNATRLQPNAPTCRPVCLDGNPMPPLPVAMPAQVHCFTAEALAEPKGRPLALHSHAKQRALFQESEASQPVRE